MIMSKPVLKLALALLFPLVSKPMPAEVSPAANPAQIQAMTALAQEVHGKGWIVYSAQTETKNWDLFIMRPDGSERRNITRSPDYNEAAARFSPDGKKMLFYRIPKGDVLDNNKYGLYELIIANSDGSIPVSYGTDYPWASWSPDGTQLACLTKTGIQMVDISARKVTRKLERKGLVQQLFWSPDGQWFCGTANGLGEQWAIGRMSVMSGAVNRVSDGDCFNCTPDWFPDSKHVIYSKGHPKTEGWAQLWMADGDGANKHMLYGEIGRHIYGGAVSPDGQYLLFTRSREDLGKVDNSFTTLALMRFQDAPIVGGNSPILHQQYPRAKEGPVLDLSWGWEPHWTFADIGMIR